MLFNSYTFILFFLPITLVLYYLAQKFELAKTSKIILILASLYFYAYFHVEYIFVILASVLINYGLTVFCNKRESDLQRKWITGVGIGCDIVIIGFFKYLDFIIDNINSVCGSDIGALNILMPLGISFFTFQQISFLIDNYRKEINDIVFIDYFLFVVFFPQLIAGPIVRFTEMVSQFQKKNKFSWDSFSEGLYIFSMGLGKKVLLADVFGRAVNTGFLAFDSLSSLEVWAVSLCYTIQIYFDFSGYCDMAFGIAKMLGFVLPVNFNSPYKSLSIADFWDRWHLSLTKFFTSYLYIPLGGSRKGKLRTYLNVLIVFTLSGIWHGANWTFILWGIYNGILMVLYRVTKKYWDAIPKVIRYIVNFIIIDIGWMLFRANRIKDFWIMLKRMFGFVPGAVREEITQYFQTAEIQYVIDHIGLLKNICEKYNWGIMTLFFVLAFCIVLLGKNLHERAIRLNVRRYISCVIIFVWSLVSLSGVSTFLYFNF
ncbi:MAG: MBOAT family protein [Lachnospiraceae bacterium]|nr:MBOAT family protein [Lachnospiraceae bacterium]